VSLFHRGNTLPGGHRGRSAGTAGQPETTADGPDRTTGLLAKFTGCWLVQSKRDGNRGYPKPPAFIACPVSVCGPALSNEHSSVKHHGCSDVALAGLPISRPPGIIYIYPVLPQSFVYDQQRQFASTFAGGVTDPYLIYYRLNIGRPTIKGVLFKPCTMQYEFRRQQPVANFRRHPPTKRDGNLLVSEN